MAPTTNDPERERAEHVKAVASALKEGQMPTTHQAVQGLDALKRETSQSAATQGLSTDGKKVVADFEQILSTSQTVLKQTMGANELQNAIYHAKRALNNSSLSSSDVNSAAQRKGNDAATALLQAGSRAGELAELIATSPEFRQLMRDMVNIAQDVLHSNIKNASSELADDDHLPENVRKAARVTNDKADRMAEDRDLSPEEKGRRLRDTAQNAADNTEQQLHEGRRKAEDAARDAQDRATGAGRESREAVGQSLADGKNLRSSAHTLVDAIADQAERNLPSSVVDTTSNTIREHGAKLHTGEATPSDYKNSALQQAKEYSQNIQSQLQDPNSQLRQTGARVARQLTDLPKETRRDLVRRIKDVIRSIQTKSAFQSAINDIIMVLRPLFDQANTFAQLSLDKIAEAPVDPKEMEGSQDARLAIGNLKQLVENLANGHSLNSLIKVVIAFCDKAREDEETMNLFSEVGTFLNRTIREVGFIDRPQYEDEAGELIDSSRNQLDKYDYYTQNISYEATSFTRALANNKTTQKLASDSNVLLADLFLDERGNATFKPDLIKDMAKLVPVLADKLAYLPIPRVEVEDEQYHMIFDNIVLHSTMLPKYVHLVSDTKIDTTKSDPNAQLDSYMMLEISKIEASARDIAWLFNKHSGLLKMGDVGLADFDIKGDGLSLRIKLRAGEQTGRVGELESDAGMKGRYIHAETVEATLNDLSLSLHDSHHDILYKMLKPLIQRTAKKQIEMAIADTVMKLFATIDDQIQKSAQAVLGASAGAPAPTKETPAWSSKAFATTEE